MSDAQVAHDHHEPTYLSHKEIVPILIGLMTGLFLAALDQTIVATSIRTIGDELQGLSVQAWVTTAYLITSTITTPLYGKLSDIFGRKPLFIWAISLFVVGSALSAFSTSMFMLAGFRAVQGLGAGGLFTMALSIIGDIVPPRERAKYQGYFIAVFGSSSVLGPVVGGFLAGQESILGLAGWRWVFFVNVPIGLVALFVVNRTLHIPNFKKVDHALDWFGALSLTIALVPMLLVAEEGRTWGWTSFNAMLCYALIVGGITWFIRTESKMGDEALIPLRLFKDKTFSLMTVIGVITGMGMFGGLAVLPLYLQIVLGSSPTQAGLQLLPLTLGIMGGSIISGQLITKLGRYKMFPVMGIILLTVTLASMTTITADTAFFVVAIMSGFFGLGLGFILQPTVLAVQNAVSPRDIGVATSSVTLFRQLGATLGTAIFLSLLFGRLGDSVAARFTTAYGTTEYQAALTDPANAATAQKLGELQTAGASAFDDTSWLATANQTLIRPIFDGFTDTTSVVFAVGAAVLAVGIIFVVKLPNLRLRGRDEAFKQGGVAH
jgi:EmrB/QacA subfamily drug resistance transporter